MSYAKFEFIGKDGSTGYRKGQIYNLEHFIKNDLIWVYCGSPDVNYCPYESIGSFLDNWERVKK